MEFKLPFPTLQNLAVLEIAHSLMDLKVSDEVANRATSLRDSLKKVDGLVLPKKQKCRIREVLKGTTDHLQNCYRFCGLNLYAHYSGKCKFQFDVYGCVDEVGMARDFLQMCRSDEQWDTHLSVLIRLLRVASYYVLLSEIHEIVPKILKLRSKSSAVPQLEGPEFEIDTYEQLCLVYRVVDQQGIPMFSNHFDYFYDLAEYSVVCVLDSCVRITLNTIFYNSELFQLHWNLLEPSKRIPFVTNLIMKMLFQKRVHQVVDIVHFLDLDSQLCILGETHVFFYNDKILRCLLVWPYQEFFLPALQLVTSLHHFEIICLFEIIVPKVDMVAFEEILCPFWEAISSKFNSRYSRLPFAERFKDLLKELSQKNVPMYKRVSADLNLPLTYLQESRKRKHNENSSSSSDV